jgi:hypothetical protein
MRVKSPSAVRFEAEALHEARREGRLVTTHV